MIPSFSSNKRTPDVIQRRSERNIRKMTAHGDAVIHTMARVVEEIGEKNRLQY
jgi:hypothetical protein